jgi:periplasmic copper chaperone A
MTIALARRLPPRSAPVLLGVVLLGGALLAGCSAGQNAETARETPDTPGVDGSVGSMVLDDVYLETAQTVPAGGSVTLRGAFTDQSMQPDRLIGVTSPVATAVEFLAPDGAVVPAGVEVPGDGQLDAATGAVQIRLTGLTGPLSPQAVVPITFEFATAGSVTLDDVPAAVPASGE